MQHAAGTNYLADIVTRILHDIVCAKNWSVDKIELKGLGYDPNLTQTMRMGKSKGAYQPRPHVG